MGGFAVIVKSDSRGNKKEIIKEVVPVAMDVMEDCLDLEKAKSRVQSLGFWQKAPRSKIKDQYRRQVLGHDGQMKWEYYRTKSNKYQGSRPSGDSWTKVGNKEHGGYSKKHKDSGHHEYWYPSAKHAGHARDYHRDKLLSSKKLKDSVHHLLHMTGAHQFLQKNKTKKKDNQKDEQGAMVVVRGKK